MPARRTQRGIASTLIIVILLAVGAAILIARALLKDERGVENVGVTQSNLRKISAALVQFASVNHRLPCPAAGTDDNGRAAPVGAAVNCTNAAGVVPWSDLSLKREESLDGWGHKIAYRVYAGAVGLTQAEGASEADCNSNAAVVASAAACTQADLGNPAKPCCAALGPGSLCNTPAHTNTISDFLGVAGRSAMLTVRDLNTNKQGVAFVLISHGATGYGAYSAEGTGQLPAPAAGGNELLNAQSGGTYYNDPPSAPGTLPTAAAHFDDVVAYKLYSDLVVEAKLGPHDWTDTRTAACKAPAGASQSFTNAAVAAALGGPANTDTGVATLTFGSGAGAITVATNIAGRDIATGSTGGAEGIGAIPAGGGGQPTVNSATGESLTFTFASAARSIGITLLDWEMSSGQVERVQFTFFLAGSPVGSPIVKSACNFSSKRGNYSLDSGATFDSFLVTPISTSGGNASTLFVSAIASCSTATCVAPGAQVGAPPAGNDCP